MSAAAMATPPRPGGRRVVGVLGGMGPLATHRFFGDLLAATAANSDQEHLDVVVVSDPLIPDRTAFLIDEGPDPLPRLLTAGTRLAHAGADLLVMPCNTASVFSARVEAATALPLVDWIETVAAGVRATGVRSVGLLATTGTIRARLYQDALSPYGITTVIPDDDAQARVMAAVYGVDGAKAGQGKAHRDNVIDVGQALHAMGAQLLILGCTELPLVADAQDPAWPCPVLDPSRVVAAQVVRLAGAPVRADRSLTCVGRSPC